MAQDILSDEFARDAYRAGNEARQEALDAGIAVTWFDNTTGQYYIEQNGQRFLAAIIDGKIRRVREVKNADAA